MPLIKKINTNANMQERTVTFTEVNPLSIDPAVLVVSCDAIISLAAMIMLHDVKASNVADKVIQEMREVRGDNHRKS